MKIHFFGIKSTLLCCTALWGLTGSWARADLLPYADLRPIYLVGANKQLTRIADFPKNGSLFSTHIARTFFPAVTEGETAAVVQSPTSLLRQLLTQPNYLIKEVIQANVDPDHAFGRAQTPVVLFYKYAGNALLKANGLDPALYASVAMFCPATQSQADCIAKSGTNPFLPSDTSYASSVARGGFFPDKTGMGIAYLSPAYGISDYYMIYGATLFGPTAGSITWLAVGEPVSLRVGTSSQSASAITEAAFNGELATLPAPPSDPASFNPALLAQTTPRLLRSILARVSSNNNPDARSSLTQMALPSGTRVRPIIHQTTGVVEMTESSLTAPPGFAFAEANDFPSALPQVTPYTRTPTTPVGVPVPLMTTPGSTGTTTPGTTTPGNTGTTPPGGSTPPVITNPTPVVTNPVSITPPSLVAVLSPIVGETTPPTTTTGDTSGTSGTGSTSTTGTTTTGTATTPPDPEVPQFGASTADGSLTIKVTPRLSDQGKQGFVYVFADIEKRYWTYHKGGWQVWSGADFSKLPSIDGDASGPAPATLAERSEVLCTQCAARLAGIRLWLGYGTDFNQMIGQKQWKEVPVLK